MKLTTKDLLEALKAGDDDAVDKAGAMQLLDNDVLLAAAKGDVDLNEVARFMLAGRGIGRDGTWVGFDEARRQLAELRKEGQV